MCICNLSAPKAKWEAETGESQEARGPASQVGKQQATGAS